MKILKILMNFIIFFCVILTFFIIFEPLFYNENTKGKIVRNDNEYYTALACTTRYIEAYYKEDYNYIKSSNTFFNRKNEDTYIKISEMIKKELVNIVLINVTKTNNVYVIEYSINIPLLDDSLQEPKVNKLVVKALDGKMKVYYDSLTVNY